MEDRRRTIAVLDDYQNVALTLADWSPLKDHATITVFNDHISDESTLIDRLRPFEVICMMRERTPMPRSIIEKLPNLKLLASSGHINAAIDLTAAHDRGIVVTNTRYMTSPTVELTWALILAIARGLPEEVASVRGGGWQQSVGVDLKESTLGILGLGRNGSEVARIGNAFGMRVIAWSKNLDASRAAEAGATLVAKDELLQQSDFISVHLVLGRRTRNLISWPELALMKSSAYLINTSRGEIIDDLALIAALRNRRIAGAALDVFDTEPLPIDHPYRNLPNVILTPHLGYVTQREYKIFYQDTVENIVAWLDGSPIRTS